MSLECKKLNVPKMCKHPITTIMTSILHSCRPELIYLKFTAVTRLPRLEEDKKVKEGIDARNGLESYLYNLKKVNFCIDFI